MADNDYNFKCQSTNHFTKRKYFEGNDFPIVHAIVRDVIFELHFCVRYLKIRY